jgi:hypothetical protein
LGIFNKYLLNKQMITVIQEEICLTAQVTICDCFSLISFLPFVVLGTEPCAVYMLGKPSTIGLHP